MKFEPEQQKSSRKIQNPIESHQVLSPQATTLNIENYEQNYTSSGNLYYKLESDKRDFF
jgi:hypothetical protein